MKEPLIDAADDLPGRVRLNSVGARQHANGTAPPDSRAQMPAPPATAAVTNVLFFTKGGASVASSRCQALGWIPFLQSAGVVCHVINRFSDDELRRLNASRGWSRVRARTAIERAWRQRLRAATAAARGADTIYLQEVALPPRLLSRVLSPDGRRRRLVLNFSDPVHVGGSERPTLRQRLSHAWWLRSSFVPTLHAADEIIVENELLAGLAGEGARATVMRGPVDTGEYRPVPRAPRDRLVVGWAGSRTTLEYFEAVVPFLKRAAASCPPLEVRLFGVERSVKVPGLTVTTVPWSLEAEKQQIPDFDIGLAYMPESGFARLRGGLKLILYMACGVPVLTSPMGIGDQVVEHGCTGMIARTPEEWVSALVRLANDPALRRELAARARERAVATYSYQAYLPEMLRVLAGRQEAM